MVLLGFGTKIYFSQVGQTLEAQETVRSLNGEVGQLNDKYDTLVSDNEELKSQLEEYQDQQATIDELNGKLTEVQKQNDTLKAENESLKSQLAEKTSSSQSSGTAGGKLVDNSDSDEMVWLSETDSKYHSISDCGRMNPNNAWQVSRSSAEAQGYDACKKCY